MHVEHPLPVGVTRHATYITRFSKRKSPKTGVQIFGGSIFSYGENRNRNGNFSTGWLETENDIDDLTIREKFIIYILRHRDEEHYRKIINSSVHEVFTIFEIDE